MDRLFCKRGWLHEYLERRRMSALMEVDDTNAEYLLNVSEEDFCQYLIRKHTIHPPVLKVEDIYAYEPVEVDIDVSRDPRRAIYDRSRPFYVKGTRVTIEVPFDGEEDLFDFRPSSFDSCPPRGVVRDSALRLVYDVLEEQHSSVTATYQRDIADIQKYLRWVAADVERYNDSLEPAIRTRVANRKKRLMANMNLATELGIPIKRRDGAPPTYAVPSVRRKPGISRPEVKPGKYQPEPVLEMAEYDRILEIIENMVCVMERSPSAFATMGEEDLRTHFLVQLNGQYEGRATGETFNYGGKTDILIREGDRNVFIAECKFWRGHSAFQETIDQLLGYTSWRDTKTAILVFNRNKDFSAVVEKVPAFVRAHPCFKRYLGRRSETSFRFVFHQPDDQNREIILTVMLFNVPSIQR